MGARLVVALLLGLAGCGRVHFDSLFDNVLVVSTTEDRLAGPDNAGSLDELDPGLTDLSLREALVIAGNTPGSDLITFDTDVFPEASPATIAIASQLPTLRSDVTVVDARGAGVIVGLAAPYTGPIVHVDGASCALRGMTFAGAITVNGGDLTIAYNAILDAPGDGIALVGVTGATLVGNRIERVAGDPIRAQMSSGLAIERNTIVIGDKLAGRGVRFETVTGSSVRDNIIDPGPAQLVSLFDSSDNEIVGNILDRGNIGVLLDGASQRNFIFRNVMIAPTEEPIVVLALATSNRIINNTFFQCLAGTSNSAPDTVEMNTLAADTGFVDPASYDFHITSALGIDQGVDIGQDMLPDRAERFLGAAPDLGAVETR
jgi:hypothetical protein